MDVKEILDMIGGVFQCLLPLIFGFVIGASNQKF